MQPYNRAAAKAESFVDPYDDILLEAGELGYGFRRAACFSDEAIEEIYLDYAARASKVMEVPTDLTFVCREYNPLIFEYGKSHVLFHAGDSAFGRDAIVASHFAPHTAREGLEMLEALRVMCTPVVFAVTERLASMLRRLGYVDTGVRAPQWWHGEEHEKVVMVNDLANFS